MRILFIGDVVGTPGCEMVQEYLPLLKKKYHPQVTILNGENAALNGRGITEKIYKNFLQAGADVITMGNHTWDNREIFDFIDDAKNLIRPANFPEKTTPGKGMTYIQVNQTKLAVINLQGRVFMNDLDNPFGKIDQLLTEVKTQTDFVFVDFHAETTSEKQAFGWHVDGRVSAVVGTHTHVQTNDARILPKGTAYLTDAGMTGPYDGVLGMQKESVLDKFKTQLPARFEVPKMGRKLLSGCLVDLEKDGTAKHIETILINEDHPFRE